MRPTMQHYRDGGFGSECYSRVLTPAAVQDAALVTTPNNGVPAELTTYFDPEAVDILTAIRGARELTNGLEIIKGDAATTTTKFPLRERTGHTEPYDDLVDGGTVGVNHNWVARDN